jgi:hypothetical protein
MKSLHLFAFISMLLFLSLAACQDKSSDENRTDYTHKSAPGNAGGSAGQVEPMLAVAAMDTEINADFAASPAATRSGAPSTDQTQDIPKKLIRTGQLTVKSTDLPAAKRKVDSLVTLHEAFYENESLENTSLLSRYDLRIRIPADKFDAFLGGLQGNGFSVEKKSLYAQDVTEEFVDLEARLSAKEAYMNRYRELLNKATKVADILEIEEKLRVLIEEQESMKGRMNYLSRQVSYGTLELVLYSQKIYDVTPEKKPGFGERFVEAMKEGWIGAVELFFSLVSNWPWIIALGLGWALIKRMRGSPAK